MRTKRKGTFAAKNTQLSIYYNWQLPETDSKNIEDSAFERDLIEFWNSSGVEHDFIDLSDGQKEHISSLKEANRRKQTAIFDELIARYIYDSLSDPILLLSDGGITFNKSLGRILCLDQLWQFKFPDRLRSRKLRQLERLVSASAYFHQNRILYPIADGVFSLKTEIIDDNAKGYVVYLHPLALAPPELPPLYQLVILLRLSGMKIKQIAYLLEIPQSRVSYISKTRGELLKHYRSELCHVENH